MAWLVRCQYVAYVTHATAITSVHSAEYRDVRPCGMKRGHSGESYGSVRSNCLFLLLSCLRPTLECASVRRNTAEEHTSLFRLYLQCDLNTPPPERQ